MSDKKQLGVRLSPRGFELAHALCDHLGLGLTGMIEVVLRREAERVGLLTQAAQSAPPATDNEANDDRGALEQLLDEEKDARNQATLERKREYQRERRAERRLGAFELLARQIESEEDEALDPLSSE
jgi:hypothetical protein